jgi:hypothetical protein
MGSCLGYILVFLCVIFVPGAIIWTMMQSRETLEELKFKNTWGPCYEGVSLRNYWTRGYHLVFILRRFIFIFVGFYFKEPVFQFIALMVLNYMMTIYITANRPLRSRFDNRLAILNEYLVNLCSFHLLFFTDEVEIETQ